MPERDTGHRPHVNLSEAAEYLGVPTGALQALVAAGYLVTSGTDVTGPLFRSVDLKAFLARNADNGAGNLVVVDADAADPEALLEALDGRSEEMARRAFDIFSTVFPEAQGWSLRRQARFIEQSRARFEAILAVTGQGAEVDEALVGDLSDVGAAAAWDGSPLPQLLIMLRISRDLVVQTAVELAEENGHHWGLALSLLLTRILPAIDRLTDALARGYWEATLARQEEVKARYEHVVEHSSDGIYEVDLEGNFQYANPSLGVILGVRAEELDGRGLSEVMTSLDDGHSLDAVINLDTGDDAGAGEVQRTALRRSDGVRRVVEIRSTPRYDDGRLVGHQGVVRDVTTASDLEAGKNEFLALATSDLRSPLETIMGLAGTMEAGAGDLPPESVRRLASGVRAAAERISRLADDLADMSRIDTSSLLLSPRPVELASVVTAAVTRARPDGEVRVQVPAGIPVVADPQRLEQVIANLVENAFVHGDPPVAVEMRSIENGVLELAVTDSGAGVPPALVPTLFSRLRTLSRSDRDRSRGTGLGLSLVRGIVEAMGGRVWYHKAASGGASFHLTLPVPRRRSSDEPLTL